KKIAAPQFRIWSPTTLLSVALWSLTNVDRTGNSVFSMVWPQPRNLGRCNYITAKQKSPSPSAHSLI
ncbi:hypothetical protein METBIDRAFT_43429, partial [Metschnikowia bicuspidata var. bicuspidata NRRL YB-4993]